MSEELEFDLVDDTTDTAGDEVIDTNDNTSEEYNDSSDEDENVDESGQDDSANTDKSNTSNFKKMSKALKAERLRTKELEAKLASNDLGDDEETTSLDDRDVRLHFLENPTDSAYKSHTMEVLRQNPSMNLSDAVLLAKAKNPMSQSSKDFALGNNAPRLKKKLSQLNRTELMSAYKAGKITDEQWGKFDTMAKG